MTHISCESKVYLGLLQVLYGNIININIQAQFFIDIKAQMLTKLYI